MARFRILSDTHQEYAENAFDLAPVPCDAVIAAGDICGPPPAAIAWLRRQLPNDRIVYVPGNHCYWQWPELAERRMTMTQILDAGREAARIHEVDLLSDDTVEIAGVRIVGSTLWTDYRIEGLSTQGAAMRTCRRVMNDYRMIRRGSSSRPTKPVDPMDLLALHRASVGLIDDVLGTAFDGPTVVVTHHAPHARSLFAPFEETNPAYASNLSWLMQRHAPPLWVHGHVHVPSDYVVDRTRVVANPRGYAGEIQQRRWDASVIVEV